MSATLNNFLPIEFKSSRKQSFENYCSVFREVRHLRTYVHSLSPIRSFHRRKSEKLGRKVTIVTSSHTKTDRKLI